MSLRFEDGIAVIVVDSPPVNTVNAAVREGLHHAVTAIRERRDAQAAVLLCAGTTFFSGADIGEFSGPPKEAEFRALFAEIETLPIPVVAGLFGTAMGGGLEIALACHYRVAVPGARFGLPEVTLGIIPGAGGTQRMPRLIGADATLDLILAAKPVDAAKGKELGFIDHIVEGEL
ncbi:MAG: enoyl-CoA hydratase/isomerase family protein, partial [Steroidobacterales bacterium]